MHKKTVQIRIILLIFLFLNIATVFAEDIEQNAFDSNTIIDENTCNAQQQFEDSNTVKTAYATEVSLGVIETQDQNINTEGWTSCASGTQNKCFQSSYSNAVYWKVEDCWASSIIDQGTICLDPYPAVTCTRYVTCPSGHDCRWYTEFKTLSSCETCSDECSQGATRCDGSYRESCGNYDSDSCFEWGARTYCEYGCSGGQCNSTPPCSDECSYTGQTQCNGNYKQVCGNYDADSCLEWNNTYCEDGCESGDCRTCTPHYISNCYNENLYWYDSCNRQEEIKENCRISCDPIYKTCVNGCKTNWNITAFDLWRNTKANTTIQYDFGDGEGWQFAGQTNSSGELQATEINPFTCPRSFDIKAISAEGADCSQHRGYVESEDDTDTYFILCPEANTNNQLYIAITTNKTSYYSGENVLLSVHVSDIYGQPVQNVFLGIILANGSIATAQETDSEGNSEYSFTAEGEGTKKITAIASKTRYKSASREKTIRLEPINLWLLDSDGDGLSNAIEEGIGTDPNDPNSNLVETVEEITDPSIQCGTFLPFGIFSNEDKQNIINELEAEDSVQAIQSFTILGLNTEANQTIFLEAAEKADSMQIFEKKDGTIIVFTNEQTGQNFLFIMPAVCEGFYKGVAYGVTQGITDDIAIATGIAYYIIYSEDFVDFAYDIQPTVNSVFIQGTTYLFACSPINILGRMLFNNYCTQVEQNLGTNLAAFLFESIGGIIVKADEVNTKYRADELQKAQFVGGFTTGYISGYWVEQIGVGKAASSIGKVGIKTAGKIAGKIGPTTVKIMKNSRYSSWVFDLGERGSMGIGRIAKVRKTASSFDEFISGLTKSEAKLVGEKIDDVTELLGTNFGKSTEQIDDIWDTISRPRHGKTYIKTWDGKLLLGTGQILDDFPQGQGRAVWEVMTDPKYSILTEGMTKEIAQVDDTWRLVNFYMEGPMTEIGSKKVDGLARTTLKDFYIEGADIEDVLGDSQKLYSKVVYESDHFKEAYSLDTTIVIQLKDGTTLSKTEIERAIWEAYETPVNLDMAHVFRVGIYDDKLKKVITVFSRQDWIKSRP